MLGVKSLDHGRDLGTQLVVALNGLLDRIYGQPDFLCQRLNGVGTMEYVVEVVLGGRLALVNARIKDYRVYTYGMQNYSLQRTPHKIIVLIFAAFPLAAPWIASRKNTNSAVIQIIMCFVPFCLIALYCAVAFESSLPGIARGIILPTRACALFLILVIIVELAFKRDNGNANTQWVKNVALISTNYLENYGIEENPEQTTAQSQRSRFANPLFKLKNEHRKHAHQNNHQCHPERRPQIRQLLLR